MPRGPYRYLDRLSIALRSAVTENGTLFLIYDYDQEPKQHAQRHARRREEEVDSPQRFSQENDEIERNIKTGRGKTKSEKSTLSGKHGRRRVRRDLRATRARGNTGRIVGSNTNRNAQLSTNSLRRDSKEREKGSSKIIFLLCTQPRCCRNRPPSLTLLFGG